jgi:hypothetical protein
MTLRTTNRRMMLALILGGIAARPGIASVRAPDAARQLIHDTHSGLALHGHDPVAYHTEGRARQGRDKFAAEALGYLWRFTSAANREAFIAAPDVYLPLFGGHDGLAVAEGRMVPGDPGIFLIAGETTVFFRNVENREAFARDAGMRRKALQDWREVALRFAGH